MAHYKTYTLSPDMFFKVCLINPDETIVCAHTLTSPLSLQVTDVDHLARSAKKDAARLQASSGWYRNMRGSVSFRCVRLHAGFLCQVSGLPVGPLGVVRDSLTSIAAMCCVSGAQDVICCAQNLLSNLSR